VRRRDRIWMLFPDVWLDLYPKQDQKGDADRRADQSPRGLARGVPIVLHILLDREAPGF